jgi:hypothetical protein
VATPRRLPDRLEALRRIRLREANNFSTGASSTCGSRFPPGLRASAWAFAAGPADGLVHGIERSALDGCGEVGADCRHARVDLVGEPDAVAATVS